MHLNTITTALVSVSLVASSAATQFLEIDWPAPNEKLNLSAPLSFNYIYSQNELFEDLTELDITFYYKRNSTDDVVWIADVVQDYTLSGRQGVVRWDPSEVLEAVQEDGQLLAAGRVHRFEAARHMSNGSYAGMGLVSEYYAVEAGGLVDSAAFYTRPVNGLVVLGLGIAAVAVL